MSWLSDAMYDIDGQDGSMGACYVFEKVSWIYVSIESIGRMIILVLPSSKRNRNEPCTRCVWNGMEKPEAMTSSWTCTCENPRLVGRPSVAFEQ